MAHDLGRLFAAGRCEVSVEIADVPSVKAMAVVAMIEIGPSQGLPGRRPRPIRLELAAKARATAQTHINPAASVGF
ncbi:MAG: hypothetical protein LBO20_07420 [Bifidobacteriaceae bacterium]|nr:hypothetical protein [Bifidobacteriaceae bacterium]